ncbi:PRKR-interacting protein 1 homolog [Rhodnius prolixus]|uniref:Prkr-interacting protein 1 n=2 Tax=Rhodnius TaxID=13248 RepID=T1HCY2_RHOPR
MNKSSGEVNSDEKSTDEEKPVVVKNATGLQRLKLEKLMKNPDKPVVIPDRQKEKKQPHVPDFVRNVMGSSAGAGSGEFHVYRHLRRKEYARQKYIQEKGEKALLDEEYQQKLEENKRIAEEKTAKKRAKRLKLKDKLKKKKLKDKKLENKEKVQSDQENSKQSDENVESSESSDEKNS